MTGTVASSVEVANKACSVVGLDPITTFVQVGSVVADFFNENYEPIVSALLEEYYWRFAMATYELTFIDQTTHTKWDSRFVKPNDALAIKKLSVAGAENMPIGFDIYDDEVHCNADSSIAVYAETVRRVNEAYWPAMFVRGVTLSLCADLAGSAIMERPRSSANFRQASDDILVKLKGIQSMSRTTEAIPHTRFAAARRGRAGTSGLY